MCPQERLVIISKQTGLSFVLKRIGPLAAIISLAFYLLVLYSSVTSKPLEYLFVSIYSESFIETAANTFCSSLGSTFLLIEDTTIHPLYLWVIIHLVELIENAYLYILFGVWIIFIEPL